MTGMQRGAYRFQSICLMCFVVAFLCNMLTWYAASIFLQIVGIVCLVKAMMYRERWEVDYRFELYQKWLREQDDKLE